MSMFKMCIRDSIYVIGEPRLDARGNTGCPTTLPMNKFLSIFKKNFEKNHGNGGNASGTD